MVETEQFPDWVPKDRRRWPPKCTPNLKAGGWVRWYKGRTVWVCGKTVPLDKVDDRWRAKQDAIDKGESLAVTQGVDSSRTYGWVLSEFLDVQQARVGAARHSIADRTFHNYTVALNDFGEFVHDGRKMSQTDIRQIGPSHFTAYAAKFKGWKASGFDSVVCRVGALFRWSVEMEYIDRYRPGPQFQRPGREEIRSQRIALSKSFTVDEVAKLYVAASHSIRCWIGLGICAAFNNSDIANLTRSVIDLNTGVIDFRRRKTGKIRRIIPLPADVVTLLNQYARPEPAKPQWEELFFVTEYGNPYARAMSRSGDYMPSDSISRLFGRLMIDNDVSGNGRNFSGLRTTHFNMLPQEKWPLERKIVMGHAQGEIGLDHYLERIGMVELTAYVETVWQKVRHAIEQQSRL